MGSSQNEPHVESWWDVYQQILHEKQLKEKVECNTQESSNMDFMDTITNENSPKPIQSEVEFEEIIIETVKWEEEGENEFNNV